MGTLQDTVTDISGSTGEPETSQPVELGMVLASAAGAVVLWFAVMWELNSLRTYTLTFVFSLCLHLAATGLIGALATWPLGTRWRRATIAALAALWAGVVAMALVVLPGIDPGRHIVALYTVCAVGGAVVGAWWSLGLLRGHGTGIVVPAPRGHLRGLAFFVSFALVVLGLIVATAVGTGRRNRGLSDTVLTVPEIRGLPGNVVSLGDAFSAGEGLAPSEPYADLDTTGNGCRRAARAYPRWLRFQDGPRSQQFAACADAVVADLYLGFDRVRDDGSLLKIAPQVGGQADPGVGLVTLTIGATDVALTSMVQHCLVHDDCLREPFDPAAGSSARNLPYPPAAALRSWAAAATLETGARLRVLFKALKAAYPKARIVVIGYPYLTPAGRAAGVLSDCASILRRFDEAEREGVRAIQRRFNDLTYELAVAAGIDFVSTEAAWDGHEPCGDKVAFSSRPRLFSTGRFDALAGGMIHLNEQGHRQIAQLVSCYLAEHPTLPQRYLDGDAKHIEVTTDALTPPASLGMLAAPGSADSPLRDCAPRLPVSAGPRS